MTVEFHHGALAEDYEKQANAQGLTFGDKVSVIESIGAGLVLAHIYDCLTDSEYNKALQRFQKKVMMPNLNRRKKEGNER